MTKPALLPDVALYILMDLQTRLLSTRNIAERTVYRSRMAAIATYCSEPCMTTSQHADAALGLSDARSHAHDKHYGLALIRALLTAKNDEANHG